MKVAWDASHGEFTIEDYYYFSKLKKFAQDDGVEIEEVKNFSKLAEYDIIVFNYPEIRFRRWEISRIRLWLRKGKRIILTAYYANIDGVAENVNRILRSVSSMKVNYDVIKDEFNNYGDEMFPLAYHNGLNLVMPCSASVSGGNPIVTGKGVFGAKENSLICLGTCVFWDNYSIELADNRDFSLSLLRGEV